MPVILEAPWLVVVVPFALAGLIALLGKRGISLAPWIASVGPLLVIALSFAALMVTAGKSAQVAPWTSALASRGSVEWFSIAATSFSLGWAIDSLAAIMLAVVGVVALCVVVFSAGYMAEDPGWNRYFALLALFTGSMSLLVIGDSLLTLFIGWELVGACSYLLIGFWFAKPSAAAAAVKAFLTTRVGDVGLLLGIAIMYFQTGTLGYAGMVAHSEAVPAAWLTAAVVCIAIGAIGKSAQFPLHAWLPDAMEGPTPVSALIHAATMVAAGVYLVVRVWPLFELTPTAQTLLLTVGTISALGAALVAIVQRDIKKVLAYSTVSQLGFMFAALGVGAWEAAFFHLVTHAAFKGLLFLGSGSVIHGSGTQDVYEMGGLRKAMPITFVTWCIGVLALAGTPGFAGFFSKDAVLESVFAHAPIAGVCLFAASTLTAFYVARTTRLAFFGTPATDAHAHESGMSMLAPLIALSVPAIGLGWLGATMSESLGAEPEPLAVAVSAAAVGLALLGGAAGWFVGRTPESDAAFAGRLGRLAPVLRSAYGWNTAVDRVVVRPTVTLCRVIWAWGDRLIADGIAEGTALLARSVGSTLSRLQTGDGQSYALAIVVGIAVMLVASVLLGR